MSDGPEMTPDTVFWLLSMTKAVTATACMQLVERGKLYGAFERGLYDGLSRG
jgi:CubicO group peptidase (beta-lactamase class C family)